MATQEDRKPLALGVSLPAGVYATVHAITKLQGATPTAIASEAIGACFAGLLDEVELAQEMQRRGAQLGNGEELKP